MYARDVLALELSQPITQARSTVKGNTENASAPPNTALTLPRVSTPPFRAPCLSLAQPHAHQTASQIPGQLACNYACLPRLSDIAFCCSLFLPSQFGLIL